MSGIIQSSPAVNELVRFAEREIKLEFGDTVSVTLENKSFNVFGVSENIGSVNPATVMTLPAGIFEESYVSDNLITHFASDSALDVGTPLLISGHTIDISGDFTAVQQVVILNGQNKTALTTPLARIHSALNVGAVNLNGTIYFSRDVAYVGGVPQVAAEIHLIIPAGKNLSRKSAITTSLDEYFIVTSANVSVLEKAAANASVDYEIRRKGGVFIGGGSLEASNSSGAIQGLFDPYILVTPNSDIRAQALASGNNIEVAAGFVGYRATVI
ncbi:MAG: hypothetical protein ACYS1A_19260 [Planctomycetota bacterium]|jgi:hypothetical protein